MSRYIDADALKEKFTSKWILDRIDQHPTADVVEVVRCKDCMFNHWHETPNGEKYHICNLNQLAFSEHADFYCAYGERREDDKGRNTTSI